MIGFFVVTFLLSLDLLLDYLDLFLGKGIPLWTVGRLFILGLGWMIALSVPCGILVAVLMAYGQMSQDNEITALRASGINPFYTMAPALTIALVTAAGLALFNNYVLPETNHAFANLAAQIHRIRPTAQIQEGIFIDDFKGYNLFIRELEDRTGEMRDVLIIDGSENRRSPRTILAKEGLLEYLADQNAISLTLRRGTIHEIDPSAQDSRYRRLTFEEQTMVLTGASDAIENAVRSNRGQREMSVTAMNKKILSFQEELSTFAAQIDSSLAQLEVDDPSELPPLDVAELEPKRDYARSSDNSRVVRQRSPNPTRDPNDHDREETEDRRATDPYLAGRCGPEENRSVPGGDPEEILDPFRLYRLRLSRGSTRHAGASRGNHSRFSFCGLLSLLLPLPDRR